jgi:hypothetical protein
MPPGEPPAEGEQRERIRADGLGRVVPVAEITEVLVGERDDVRRALVGELPLIVLGCDVQVGVRAT